MKKADFVQKLAEKLSITQKDTDLFLDAFAELVTKIVKSGDEVALPELGKWILKKKPARTARNPITGATVKVPAKVVPQFKASKKFKDGVAG